LSPSRNGSQDALCIYFRKYCTLRNLFQEPSPDTFAGNSAVAHAPSGEALAAPIFENHCIENRRPSRKFPPIFRRVSTQRGAYPREKSATIWKGGASSLVIGRGGRRFDQADARQ
jgi:hypothetical protein